MNIFDLPPFPICQEMTDILAQNKNVRIERIISSGQVSVWYDQAETEFVILLKGEAEIEYENGKMSSLSKGDTLLIRELSSPIRTL